VAKTGITWAQRLTALAFLVLVMIEERLIRFTKNGKKTFFDTGDFAWVARLEESAPLIQRELESVLTKLELIPNFQDIQLEQRRLTMDDGWKTFFFCGYGARHQKNIERCPETNKLLDTIPGLTTAFFSILRPKKRLRRHRGPYKGVLRYHLALKVPENADRCGIKVGQDVRRWEEGKSLIFDDTHLHEAWNDTDEVRVVLFVDFVRPLPPLLAALNRFVLRLISKTTFVKSAVRRLENWEEMFGAEFDAR
jgi:ornithine lipid ester-linked acyl 2-hydroxylase